VHRNLENVEKAIALVEHLACTASTLQSCSPISHNWIW
jgi:hypothetical protein